MKEDARSNVGVGMGLLNGIIIGALATTVVAALTMWLLSSQEQAPVVQESELAEVLTKLDTLKTGLDVVHANQSVMWTNGIVKLRQGQNLLLRAQIKAGTIKVEKKETTEKETAE